MNEDHSETAAPDASLPRGFLTAEAPPAGAPGPVRSEPGAGVDG